MAEFLSLGRTRRAELRDGPAPLPQRADDLRLDHLVVWSATRGHRDRWARHRWNATCTHSACIGSRPRAKANPV
jgi:hypothetical protein